MVIVCTIPGPKEPSCSDLNPYLTCMVNDLKKLWDGVEMRNPISVLGSRLIRAALLCISSDLPATRKVCGFYGLKAKYGCSKCLKLFPTVNLQTNYSGFERNAWPLRDIAHRKQVERSKLATTKYGKEQIQQEFGIRYSQLLELPYFDVVRCHLVDPMHNLFLGTAKKLLTLWKDHGYLSTNSFVLIQKEIDDITPPSNIGRIPHKISAGFSGFTAEQWMLWTTLYSPLLLFEKLPPDHFELWSLFSQAC